MLLKSIIQWLLLEELAKIRGHCTGCQEAAPDQKSHLGLSGCLEDVGEIYNQFKKDIHLHLNASIVSVIYRESRKVLGISSDAQSEICSSLAIELYIHHTTIQDLVDRDNSFDKMFADYKHNHLKKFKPFDHIDNDMPFTIQ